jgi:hypothetical protein
VANDTIDTVDQVAKGTPPQLSPKCLRAVEEIGRRTSFSQDAVTSMLVSIVKVVAAWRSSAIPILEVRDNGWPAARS